MTDPQPQRPVVNNTVLIVAATAVVVVTIGAIALVAVAIEDGARASSMIALIGAPLTLLLGFLGMFITLQNIGAKVERTERMATELTNGLGDAKTRAAVADVLPDHLIDPAMREQIERDRVRRANAAAAAARLVEPHAFPDPDDLVNGDNA